MRKTILGFLILGFCSFALAGPQTYVYSSGADSSNCQPDLANKIKNYTIKYDYGLPTTLSVCDENSKCTAASGSKTTGFWIYYSDDQKFQATLDTKSSAPSVLFSDFTIDITADQQPISCGFYSLEFKTSEARKDR